jgi:arginine-tRNA-protein transferase
VDEFAPKRSQRRAVRQHQTLTATIVPLTFKQTHFELYTAYQVARHEGTDEKESVEQYRNFLVQSNVESLMVEFRLNDVLKMVSVVDIVRDGVSAVYTFYDTGDKSASYGTYNVLWLAEWCRRLQLPYLYLGYWIAQSQKMAYKQNFAPQQGLVEDEWRRLNHVSKNP